jgi:hypothetical protein
MRKGYQPELDHRRGGYRVSGYLIPQLPEMRPSYSRATLGKPLVQVFSTGGTIVGKNKNRGERTGQERRRDAESHPHQSESRTATQEHLPIPGSVDQPSHKRGKKFGHN